MFPFPIYPSYIYLYNSYPDFRAADISSPPCSPLPIPCQPRDATRSQAWLKFTLSQFLTTSLALQPRSFGLPTWSVTWALYTFTNWILVPTFPWDPLGFSAWFVDGFLHSDLGPALWNVYPESSLATEGYAPGICSLVSTAVVLESTVPTPCHGSPPSHCISLIL